MIENYPSKEINPALSWIEWTVAIGIAGMGLSLAIYSLLAACSFL
jgi:hypothetical protein